MCSAMELTLDREPQRSRSVERDNDRWVVHRMSISIRIAAVLALGCALALALLLAGVARAHQGAVSHVNAGPVLCCDAPLH